MISAKKYLKSIWLSEIEVEIYVTCYRYWWSTISSLARITKIPRTTIHDATQKLTTQWRLIAEKKWKGYYYTAIDTDGIEWVLMTQKLQIQKNISQLNTIKQEFEELKVIDHAFTNITHYKWLNAISTIYKKVQHSKTLRAVFNPEKWIEYSNYSTQELTEIMVSNQIESYEILWESQISDDYASMMENHDTHQVKILPQSEMSQFHADHLITDDKFFFITFWEEILGIEITNKIFVDAQKVIFDSLRRRLY